MIMISWTKLLIYGALIGVANIIPGVSGGTMAVILNVYNQLISSISNIRKEFQKSVRFLFPIGIGAVIGILIFSKIISFAIENHNMITNFFFIGLVIGSTPMLINKTITPKFKPSVIPVFIISLAIMLGTIFIIPDDSQDTIITTLTLFTFLKLFICSAIASMAMIIPGISGSFILLLLGCYTTILSALDITQLNVPILIPVALGILAGIGLGAKVINKLFELFPRHTYSAVCGLVVGSLFGIYPGFTFNLTGLIAIVFLIIGTSLTLWFTSSKRESVSISHKKTSD